MNKYLNELIDVFKREVIAQRHLRSRIPHYKQEAIDNLIDLSIPEHFLDESLKRSVVKASSTFSVGPDVVATATIEGEFVYKGSDSYFKVGVNYDVSKISSNNTKATCVLKKEFKGSYLFTTFNRFMLEVKSNLTRFRYSID